MEQERQGKNWAERVSFPKSKLEAQLWSAGFEAESFEEKALVAKQLAYAKAAQSAYSFKYLS